jgi:hypothetical protein
MKREEAYAKLSKWTDELSEVLDGAPLTHADLVKLRADLYGIMAELAPAPESVPR